MASQDQVAPVVKKQAGPKDKKKSTRPPVPETLRKMVTAKRERNAYIRATKQIALARRKETRKIIFRRAEKYVREYQSRDRHLIKQRRAAKQRGAFFREPEAKIAVVVRIRGINGVDPRTKKILQLLRLRQIHNAVFVRLNAATQNMLRLVEPYIAFGTPNLKTIRELVYKRGFAKINHQRIPIVDNALVENHLKKFNVICLEDIIHEIYTVGPKFKQVNRFLWPFKLNCPRGGFSNKKKHFQEGGDAGNREDKINSFVQRMN
jgi:large subunit ribosomal protein L7e